MSYNPLDHVPLTHWLLLGPLLIAAYTDTRYGLIYNWLTFPAALVLGTILWMATSGQRLPLRHAGDSSNCANGIKKSK